MHELADWIDQIDRALSRLRERDALVYYEADVSGQLDVEALRCIAEERRCLLLDPDVTTRAGSLASEGSDAVARRKGERLRLQILATRVDEDPQLLRLRHELEQTQHASGDKLNTPEGIRGYLDATGDCRKARIQAGNRVARSVGYRSYPEAKLASQELTVRGLAETLAKVQRACAQDCLTALSGIEAADLSYMELDRAVSSRLSPANDGFPPENQDAIIRSALSAFGQELATLPISVERRALPYPGAVHTLSIGRDIRLLLNTANRGFSAYSIILHELGHALYYCSAPDSVLLLDGRIAREGLAEFWAGLLARQEWLQRFTDLADCEIRELQERRRRWHAYNNMVLAQWAHFELRLYEDPDAAFLDLWNDVTRECLGVETRAEIYPPFVFLYPLDIKDYIYAHLITQSLTSELERRFGGSLLGKDVLQFMWRPTTRAGTCSHGIRSCQASTLKANSCRT